MATRKRAHAYHEAGHAVAANVHRVAGHTTLVTMEGDDLAAYNADKPNEEHVGGYQQSVRTLPIVRSGRIDDREAFEARLLVILAGAEAEMLFTGNDRAGGRGDYRLAQRLLSVEIDVRADVRAMAWTGKGPTEPEIRALAERTADELTRRFEERRVEAREFAASHWLEIHLVAEALWKHRRLSGDEVQALLDEAARRRKGFELALD